MSEDFIDNDIRSSWKLRHLGVDLPRCKINQFVPPSGSLPYEMRLVWRPEIDAVDDRRAIGLIKDDSLATIA